MGKEGKRWCMASSEEGPPGLLMCWTGEKMGRGICVIALAISGLVGAPRETTQAVYSVHTKLSVSAGGVKENQGFQD